VSFGACSSAFTGAQGRLCAGTPLSRALRAFFLPPPVPLLSRALRAVFVPEPPLSRALRAFFLPPSVPPLHGHSGPSLRQNHRFRGRSRLSSYRRQCLRFHGHSGPSLCRTTAFASAQAFFLPPPVPPLSRALRAVFVPEPPLSRALRAFFLPPPVPPLSRALRAVFVPEPPLSRALRAFFLPPPVPPLSRHSGPSLCRNPAFAGAQGFLLAAASASAFTGALSGSDFQSQVFTKCCFCNCPVLAGIDGPPQTQSKCTETNG